MLKVIKGVVIWSQVTIKNLKIITLRWIKITLMFLQVECLRQ